MPGEESMSVTGKALALLDRCDRVPPRTLNGHRPGR
jgi:hypothetical protein